MRGKVKIRTATSDDVPGIQRLFEQGDAHHAQLLPRVFRPAQRARPDDLIESGIKDEASDVILAVEDSRVVAFLDIKVGGRPDYPMFIPKRCAVVENMVVDEEHRGAGIGSRLLEEAKAWAEARGLEAVQLTVWSENLDAIRLYERLGFKPIIQRMELDL